MSEHETDPTAASEADRATAGERDLRGWLVERVRQSGRTQKEIAESIGITEKHMSQMMRHETGTIATWQRVLDVLPATPPADDANECEDGVFGTQDIANALGGIGPVDTPDATASEPLSEAEQSWGIPYSGRHIFMEQDVERIVAAREAAAATRARAEGAAAALEVVAVHRLHPSMNICVGCDWRAIPNAGSLRDQHWEHIARIARSQS